MSVFERNLESMANEVAALAQRARDLSAEIQLQLFGPTGSSDDEKLAFMPALNALRSFADEVRLA
jgi:hypothetical protein